MQYVHVSDGEHPPQRLHDASEGGPMNAENSLGIQAQTHQSLAITRQSIQAIEILEYTQAELDAYLADQIERNPLLRREVESPSLTNGTPATASMGFRVPSYSAAGQPSREPSDTQSALEAIGQKTSLYEHLCAQLSHVKLTRTQRNLAAYLIYSLEPDGYLRTPLEDLAELLQIPAKMFEDALRVVQSLVPAGVGARSLRECLWLQLRDQERLTPNLEMLLVNLHLVERGEIMQLAKRCNVSANVLGELLGSLRALNPKPGNQFDTDPIHSVIPDVLVSLNPIGRIHIEINPIFLPRVAIDRSYYVSFSRQLSKRDDQRFLQLCWREANTLIHNLDQRIQTTLKIVTAIITKQMDFIVYGDQRLRPLRQKDIAETLNLHESTVSRVVTNKYVQCPFGIFPIKHLFSTGLPTQDHGQEIASAVVRDRIKSIIANETPGSALSDDAIVNALQHEHVTVARRTVTKYRRQLRIPSSVQRHRLRRLPGYADHVF